MSYTPAPAPDSDGDAFGPRQQRRLPHRVALFIVGLLLLSIVALLPFALAGVIEEVSGGNGPNYTVVPGSTSQTDSFAQINLRMTSIDEWQHLATIQASGNRSCPTSCPYTDRIQLISVPTADQRGQGLPPYATLQFPPNQKGVSQQITLPISGAAIRYPFDHYTLELAVVVQRVFDNGVTQTVQVITPETAPGYLSLSVTGSVPKTVMAAPAPVNVAAIPVNDPGYRYYAAGLLTFERPLYLQVLSIALVLLVSAAAAYAVFMRPLDELVLGAGATVLGVWGVRAVLLGPDVPGFTLIDLSLMVVILFLLVALTWRALLYLYDRSQVSLTPSRRGRRPQARSDFGEAEPVRRDETSSP